MSEMTISLAPYVGTTAELFRWDDWARSRQDIVLRLDMATDRPKLSVNTRIHDTMSPSPETEWMQAEWFLPLVPAARINTAIAHAFPMIQRVADAGSAAERHRLWDAVGRLLTVELGEEDTVAVLDAGALYANPDCTTDLITGRETDAEIEAWVDGLVEECGNAEYGADWCSRMPVAPDVYEAAIDVRDRKREELDAAERA